MGHYSADPIKRRPRADDRPHDTSWKVVSSAGTEDGKGGTIKDRENPDKETERTPGASSKNNAKEGRSNEAVGDDDCFLATEIIRQRQDGEDADDLGEAMDGCKKTGFFNGNPQLGFCVIHHKSGEAVKAVCGGEIGETDDPEVRILEDCG